ncbi:DUF3108 domain-containing protein [Enterovirga sp.]|uniref:DUF3108 domain-containing protein n=1 Tax=Enterovirga sp. TaxID=2026350 RepID=UPI0026213A76|nr:DUF3108 domain-containing protein [Enterovirga sp.]MDB5591856.1 hypothetical protein [Enterovirga sp.]
MPLIRRLSARAGVLAALIGFALPAAAAGLKVDYRILLGGLQLGTATFSGTFDDSRYDMRVNGQLTGLVGMFSGGSQGAASTRGQVSGARLVSSGFSATGRAGSKERTVQLGIAGGNVTAIEINPPFEDTEYRVPLVEASKRGIIDPLSGMVAVAANPARPTEAANCNRTVPVFDGTQRFDVVLSFVETRVVRKPGFTGSVLVCSARYIPVAGHKPSRASVKFMQEARDISVWLAPVEGTRFLAPIRISVPTLLGTTVVEADNWSLDPGNRRASAQ